MKGFLYLADMLRRRKISAEELCRAQLERISQSDGEIGAFITVTPERALRAAREIDARRRSGEALPALAGIPFAAKDNLCTKGVLTSCGSRMLEDFVPPYSASVVNALTGEGAVMLGKTNMDEFAMGSFTTTSYFGVTKNPRDTSRAAGGSSGGSAAAVAAGMAAFALATDTGGSARQPAAACGMVAIKPTYGAVSRYGLISFAPSLEQICPITTCVRSNALVAGSMIYRDLRDATSVTHPCADMLSEIEGGVRGLRILHLDCSRFADGEVTAAVSEAARAYERLGAHVNSLTLEEAIGGQNDAAAAYYVISSAEAASELARFDGVRYGRRGAPRDSADAFVTANRSEGFGEEVKRRIMLGNLALCKEGREHLYLRARAAADAIRGRLESLLCKYDALMLPVMPTVAHRFEDVRTSALDIYKEDALTVLANLSGLPALTLPCGRGEGGMPIGLQLIGARFTEPLLYRVAASLEDELSSSFDTDLAFGGETV